MRAFHRSNSNLELLQGLDVEPIVGDLADINSLINAAHGIDVIFHCAAQLGQTPDSNIMITATVNGTRNVLQAALANGVQRVIHTSSIAALGIPPHRRSTQFYFLDETHSWNYRSEWWMYGHTKYLAELEVQKAVAQGLDVVIVNPTIVLGAGDIHRVSGSVVIFLAKHTLPVAVEGGANIVHITDVVDGHLAALNFGKTAHRYILGGENLSHFDFLSRVAKVVQSSPPKWIIPAGVLKALSPTFPALEKLIPLPISTTLLRLAGYYFYYDTNKSHQELHLPPPRPIDDAILQCYQWYLEKGVLS